MANTTKHNDVRQGPGGRLEAAHLIISRYATAPAKAKDGEIWYDVTNNLLKVNVEGTVKSFAPV